MLLVVDSHNAQEPSQLIAALVDAFPSYLFRRIAELRVVAGAPVAAAVAQGADELAQRLEEMLGLPAVEQVESPLALVREATRPVTATLMAMGVKHRERDAWETEAHPADVFGLYPASSSDLGEEAWRLHLQWGLEKAKTVAGVVPVSADAASIPVVAVFGTPSDERAEIDSAVGSCGYRLVVWRNPAALERAGTVQPVLVLVDLRHPHAHDAIRTLVAKGIRVVATGPDVNDLTTPGLLALGAEETVNSVSIAARLGHLLPRLA
jgi:hypothetical protein